MFRRGKEGFQSNRAVPTTAAIALTEFYTNTYEPAAKYLPGNELLDEKTIAGFSTSFRLVAQKAFFCLGPPVRLSIDDTDDFITTLMNAATRSLISSLIRAYSSTYIKWTGRGVLVTRATTVDPSDPNLTSEVLSARDAYIGTNGHWPVLLSAIQTLVRNVSIGNAKKGYALLTGTPVGVGRLGQSTKPMVATLNASGATLYGSHTGATSFGFFWSTSSMETGTGTSITGSGTNGFTATLSGLTSGTTYYYKAWATNASGTNHGVEQSFVYAVAPTLSASTHTLTTTNVTLSCTVRDEGAPIIEKGFVLIQSNTQPSSLTITTPSAQVVMDISSGTSISSTINITQRHFYVAYAMNSIGTTYTNIVSLVPPIPGSIELVRYEPIKDIKVFSMITSIGNGTYVEAGIVYSATNAMPTVSDTKIVFNGQYTLNALWSVVIPNMSLSVNIRSYVTTSHGTSYSSVTSNARPFGITFTQNNYLTQAVGAHNVYVITGSLSFTITQQVRFNYLLVGGGGGGGNGGDDRTGGGGGGGGCLQNTLTFSAGTYTIRVGAGGSPSSSGENSVIQGPSGFAQIRATGGGAGGFEGNPPRTGGSGGGGFHGSNQEGANGTTGQGMSGGKGYDSAKPDNIYCGGGGGGQSANGSDGAATGAGNGGAGLTITSSNLPGFSTSIGGKTIPSSFGGGGGGGFQNLLDATGPNGSGSSGGGNGASYIKSGSSINATNGTPNSGGGGGGCAYDDNTLYNAGSGGSGILILTVAV